ncbi:MAG: prolyl-tRNA synthetase associated domain-containing protein [Clostridia bacterium]|nr:prolyl-tRNA synthetase associated domain-containing protein [Clostridia bacterium]
MDYTLENGRPQNTNGRLKKEIKVYDYLDNLSIQYDRVDHPPFDTMEDCAETDKLLGVSTVKNLLLCNSQKTEFYMLIMPADKKFKTKELSKQIGSARLSFASGEHMEKLLDITPGSLTILGLINDPKKRVRLLIDRDVCESEYIVAHPCINTSSLRIKTSDILGVFLPSLGRDAIFVDLIGEE